MSFLWGLVWFGLAKEITGSGVRGSGKFKSCGARVLILDRPFALNKAAIMMTMIATIRRMWMNPPMV